MFGIKRLVSRSLVKPIIKREKIVECGSPFSTWIQKAKLKIELTIVLDEN